MALRELHQLSRRLLRDPAELFSSNHYIVIIFSLNLIIFILLLLKGVEVIHRVLVSLQILNQMGRGPLRDSAGLLLGVD